MKFARYWALGEAEADGPRGRTGASTWRWSDISQEDAQRQADEAARRLAERRAANGQPLDRYAYADRPLREPVLQSFPGPNGREAVVVTRNAYGAVVLNTSSVLFVDVDLPETPSPRASGGGLLGRLFGRSSPPPAPPPDPAEEARTRARGWALSRPGWGWRVYRTAAGLRLLATHRSFDPGESEVAQVFEATGADPLYRKLCQVQSCFRARLTPKPWRCGTPNPPRWPFRHAGQEAAFARWQSGYEASSKAYATCRFEGTAGAEAIHPEVAAVVRIHDDLTRAAETGLPLA
jgi:hypothetical protein